MDAGIFKAYDIRGRYPAEINEAAVQEISRGLRRFFKTGKIVVARDARLSSPALYRTVIKELGRRVIPAGLATTPFFYFLVNRLKAAGGIMVTASHNPKEWNGLKVVGPKAKMISGHEVLKTLRRFS